MRGTAVNRNRSRLMAALLVLALCCVAWGGPVLAAPPQPYTAYGTIKLNGVNVADGLLVTAWCAGVQYGSGLTHDGGYYGGLSVKGDDPDPEYSPEKDGCSPSETVAFRIEIGGIRYALTPFATWVSAYSQQVNLTVGPLAADLTSFSADARPGKVSVNWQTASEADLLGFNLYRSADAQGMQLGLASKLNARLIPSRAAGPGQGAAYRYTDVVLESGGTYFYWIEEINASGAKQVYGPVTAALPELSECGDGVCAAGATDNQ